MSQEESWKRLLCDALTVLALPPDEQVLANGPGCVSCDLLEDFHHARTITLGNALGLSEGQRGLLDRIDSIMRAMEPPDVECFNNEAIRRPAWQKVRELATETLREFGWEGDKARPPAEVEQGVWHRPLAEPPPTA